MSDNKEGLSKKELYDLEKEKKEKKDDLLEKKKKTGVYLKRAIWVVIVLVVVSALVWIFSNSPEAETSDLVASNGIHWHPHLEIIINGETQEIPANIGLGAVHNPMHTHDPDGIIHLEYNGVVREDDVRLGEFFELWGKEFNESQIFEHIDGEGGELSMTVNGEPNNQYDDYLMQHEDRIVIMYE